MKEIPFPLQDTDLVARCRRGDREAFATLVSRYQSLVCAQAYSICGDFTRSEDVAQDTFLSAWRQLPQLREPSKCKAWLCGIARHLALRVAESRQREAGTSLRNHATAASTHELVAAREEEALVWQALEQLPEAYRSVLVLYYREQQSVAAVAEALDLTEDAARQRLSRGRAMLKQQVASVVETTLSRTRPSAAFTLAVMAAVPVAIPATASAGTLAMGAKSGGAGGAANTLPLLGGFLGSAIGVLGGWLGVKISADAALYERERQFIYRAARQMMWGVFAFLLVAGAGVYLLSRSGGKSTFWIAGGALAFVAAYLYWLLRAIIRGNGELRRIRREEAAAGTPPRRTISRQMPTPTEREYRSARMFLGLPLLHMVWSSFDIPLRERRPAIGWIAIGDRAVGAIAFGTLTIGVVSFGAMAVGVLAIGGMACGALALGGMALGGFAYGGVAIGWEAYGGLALALHVAFGGMAIAREFALGGVASAAQANTPLAQAAVQSSPWFWLTKASQWLSIILPVAVCLMFGFMAWMNSKLQRPRDGTKQ